MRTVTRDSWHGSRDFGAVADAFLAQPGLPFAGLLSAERIERVFTKHGNLFGRGTIYSTAMMLALLWNRGVQVCTRQHQQRRSDFRRGQRLGRHDHLVVWTKPQRPTWMDEATTPRFPPR